LGIFWTILYVNYEITCNKGSSWCVDT